MIGRRNDSKDSQYRKGRTAQPWAGKAAMLAMALAAALTMSCTCPLVSLVRPSPTVTPTPTKTPRPSVVPTDTPTPTPEDTPTFTPMPVPTDTPTVAVTDTPTWTPVPPTATRRPPTSTPTRRPATATPRPPTATSTPTYLFSLYAPVEYLPDCELTTLEGTVWDRDLPNQMGGILLKVCIEGEYWCGTVQTGQDETKGAGYYHAVLGAEGPRDGNWWVAVVDAEGKPLSQAVRFSTNSTNCEPGGIGRQWVIIDFRRNY